MYKKGVDMETNDEVIKKVAKMMQTELKIESFEDAFGRHTYATTNSASSIAASTPMIVESFIEEEYDYHIML
jgi:hypothetical protein